MLTLVETLTMLTLVATLTMLTLVATLTMQIRPVTCHMWAQTQKTVLDIHKSGSDSFSYFLRQLEFFSTLIIYSSTLILTRGKFERKLLTCSLFFGCPVTEESLK